MRQAGGEKGISLFGFSLHITIHILACNVFVLRWTGPFSSLKKRKKSRRVVPHRILASRRVVGGVRGQRYTGGEVGRDRDISILVREVGLSRNSVLDVWAFGCRGGGY